MNNSTDPKLQIILDRSNDKGLFEFNLPKTGVNVVCRLLNVGDTTELLET